MGKTRTLKSKIQRYISRKQDICCEKDFDRRKIVQQIINKYKVIHKDGKPYGEPYINYLNNDLLLFIGYKYKLVENRDVEGAQLWDEINQRMYANKMLNEQLIVRLLYELPLYYLLSFLGYASYKEAIS